MLIWFAVFFFSGKGEIAKRAKQVLCLALVPLGPIFQPSLGPISRVFLESPAILLEGMGLLDRILSPYKLGIFGDLVGNLKPKSTPQQAYKQVLVVAVADEDLHLFVVVTFVEGYGFEGEPV